MSTQLQYALEMVELCGLLGLVAVPRIPTEAMISAGRAILNVDTAILASLFTAMVDAGGVD